MREIRFRAWSKEIKKMFQKCSINWNGEVAFAWNPQEKDNNKVKDMAGTKCEEDCIPMQFTGLLDKNGREIYEGDIVNCFDDSRLCGTGVVKYGRFDSSHEGGCSRYHYHQGFFVESENGEQVRDKCEEDIDWKEVEIIGNIYESPELLSKLTTK